MSKTKAIRIVTKTDSYVDSHLTWQKHSKLGAILRSKFPTLYLYSGTKWERGVHYTTTYIENTDVLTDKEEKEIMDIAAKTLK